MTNLSPEFCQKIREARRSAGLSQSALASEVGCKQSALSMFEQGDGTKLSDEAVSKLCDKFGIEFPKKEESLAPSAYVAPRTFAQKIPHSAFCPNAKCPSHLSYTVDGRSFLQPDRIRQDPVGGKFCAVCGEILERLCPSCGAAVHEGAVCSFCGEPYVTVLD